MIVDAFQPVNVLLECASLNALVADLPRWPTWPSISSDIKEVVMINTSYAMCPNTRSQLGREVGRLGLSWSEYAVAGWPNEPGLSLSASRILPIADALGDLADLEVMLEAWR